MREGRKRSRAVSKQAYRLLRNEESDAHVVRFSRGTLASPLRLKREAKRTSSCRPHSLRRFSRQGTRDLFHSVCPLVPWATKRGASNRGTLMRNDENGNTEMQRTRWMQIRMACIGLALLGSGMSYAQQNGTVTYVYTDPQGTPLAEADEHGNITKTFDYAPYGSVAMGTSPDGPGYTGHVNDPETGLIYMQARYYDPVTGRFLSVDPEVPKPGDAFTFNRYAYGSDNPVRYIDPTGRIIQIAGDEAFVKRINKDIQQIKSKPGGAALVSKLEHTPNIIYVVQQVAGKGNETQADPSGISANHKGTGSDVRINPMQTTGGTDVHGNTSRPEYVGVAHEFGHARAIDLGVQSYDKGDGKPGTTPPSEVQAMANENMVRSEHGLPLRPAYYDPAPAKQGGQP